MQLPSEARPPRPRSQPYETPPIFETLDRAPPTYMVTPTTNNLSRDGPRSKMENKKDTEILRPQSFTNASIPGISTTSTGTDEEDMMLDGIGTPESMQLDHLQAPSNQGRDRSVSQPQPANPKWWNKGQADVEIVSPQPLSPSNSPQMRSRAHSCYAVDPYLLGSPHQFTIEDLPSPLSPLPMRAAMKGGC
jgi:hypothetical protein